MLKLIVFIHKRQDLSEEEFGRYLRDIHAPLVAQLPGLRRLVFNRVSLELSAARPDWDALAENWFDDPEAMQLALASPEGEAVQADALNFLDTSKLQFLVVHEDEATIDKADS